MSNQITTINPSNDEKLKNYTKMDLAEATQIIEESHAAFLQWRLESLEQRAKSVKAIGKALQEHKEEFSEIGRAHV